MTDNKQRKAGASLCNIKSSGIVKKSNPGIVTIFVPIIGGGRRCTVCAYTRKDYDIDLSALKAINGVQFKLLIVRKMLLKSRL